MDEPTNYCDLVMKGGITSGIVYPPALSELAKSYRFNSIGGTSAGAIAAAGAAAAEYRRSLGSGRDGFKALNDMAKELASHNKLFHLFDPPKGIRPIMRLLSALGTFGGDPTSQQSSVAGFFLKVLQPLRFIWGVFLAAALYFLVVGILMGLVGVVIGNALAALLNGLNLLPAEAVVSIVLIIGSGVLVLFAGDGWHKSPGTALGLFLLGAVVAAMICLLLAFLLPWAINVILNYRFNESELSLSTLFSTTLFLVGGTAAGLFHMVFGIFLKRVPENFYGVVNGHDADKYREEDAAVTNTASTPARPVDPTMLTDWLSVKIDQIAGIEGTNQPLTFGHLCRAGITLKMITTNISQGIPYELPFTAKTGEALIFNLNQMRRLFPAYIVRHMVDTARKDLPYGLPQGYYFMPPSEHLPVAFAMRMSLSVAIFISTVPLYTISVSALSQKGVRTELTEEDLQLNYFSDGGTSSNFPIHFFDRWLPTRPTFGINLVTLPKNGLTPRVPVPTPAPVENVNNVNVAQTVDAKYQSAVATKDEQGTMLVQPPTSEVPAIHLPEAGKAHPPTWRPVTNPIDFLFKVVDTARENHDTLQSMLPGYSERILDFYLQEGEGGINLAMSEETINKMMERGTKAGQALREFKFGPHRWIRFLTLMSSLETELEKLDDSFYRKSLDYRSLISPATALAAMSQAKSNAGDVVDPTLYQRDAVWRKAALDRLGYLIDVVSKWKEEPMSSPDAVLQALSRPDPTPHISAVRGADMSVGQPKYGKCDPMKREVELKFFNNTELDSPWPQPALRATPDLSQ